MNCLHCSHEIHDHDINIQKDIAYCRNCRSTFIISEELFETEKSNFDVSSPPSGTWFREEFDYYVAGSSVRSVYALFFVPFITLWSGGSIGTIYGSQIFKGAFDVFDSLFGLPFLIVSFVLWSFALMMIGGKVEVTFNHISGKVFVGVWKIGWSRNFYWKDIDWVKEKEQTFRFPGSQNGALQMDGRNRITFGSMLSEQRRYFLFRTLRLALMANKKKKPLATVLHGDKK
jgi:hypothetical protein